MSINHFSSDLPETQWWSSANITSSTHQQQDPSRPRPTSRDHFLTPQFYQDPHHHHHNYPPWLINSQQEPTSMPSNFHTQNTPPTTLNFNLNQNDAAADDLSDRAHQFQHESKHLDAADDADDDKEPMFEKPLTPSDVGKLNRLVIPKQHAEKYFPLGGGDSGLLLSFEDESGKSWRFRYSYWNSSQSYVLTKGWSRYVKEKRLDAGDVVLFERRRAHTDRLFIGWRRRSASAHDSVSRPVAATQGSGGGGGGEMSGSSSTSGAGAGGWTRKFYSAPHQYSSYPAHQYHHSVAPYPPDCLHAAGSSGQNSQTTAVGNSKILRLFGVNLECQQQQLQEGDESSEPSTPDGSSSLSMSSQQQLYPAAYNYGDHGHGDLTFSRDVNPMRNRRG